jgi:hypothetical protein
LTSRGGCNKKTKPVDVKMGDTGGGGGRWLVSLLAGMLCSLLVAAVSLYTFSQNLTIGNTHHEIALYRELVKEFYNDGQEYRKIRMAIERCQPLYKGWNGLFNNDQINSYLGFFEDLGLYLRRSVLSVELIDHGFGAFIVEAYEDEELKRYIREMRETAKQPEAFKDFEFLAQSIEGAPRPKSEIRMAQRGCLKSSQPETPR